MGVVYGIGLPSNCPISAVFQTPSPQRRSNGFGRVQPIPKPTKTQFLRANSMVSKAQHFRFSATDFKPRPETDRLFKDDLVGAEPRMENSSFRR